MTTLQLFNYGGQEVRTVLIDGEPWFVLTDLCQILGLTTPSRVAERLDEADVSQTHISSGGQFRQVTIVNESGMYEAVIRSDKPEAVTFRRWLTGEVLPAIRKTGSYGHAPLDLNAIDPRTLALAILEESDRANAAESRVLELAPKAEAFEKFIEADGSLSLGAVANMFKVGRQTLFDWLRAAKVIQADRRPYQEFALWFEVKASSGERNSGATWVTYSSKLLPSGVDPLFRLLVRRGYITPDAA
ncbi:phage antirepressor [Arthrobacter sp. MA-N2]|uniref:phage antirepressor n=1 Tax=Arthrobacter sp. MA-N2 TaxID=1101188 RepID=UPI0004AC9B80|nr:phage antirepressor [Arthrobacter sp. MA-N2]